MIKKIFLVLCILLTLASLSGYFFLYSKAVAGAKLLITGQQKYNQGARKLNSGKKQLSAGKKKLESGTATYREVTLGPLGDVVSHAPIVSILFSGAHEKIKKGNEEIVKGEQQVKAGEAKLIAGKIALAKGRKKLAQAEKIRLGFVAAAVVFGLLSITLIISIWRRRRKRRR